MGEFLVHSNSMFKKFIRKLDRQKQLHQMELRMNSNLIFTWKMF